METRINKCRPVEVHITMALPNVLLVVLDSARARNMGTYGYHRETDPFLRSYADRATLYRQARAPGIHSVASHASLWTGEHVATHGAIRHEDELQEGTTVWEELAAEGYETGIFTTNPVVAHASNLSEPFDERVTDNYVETDEKRFPEAHGPADVVKHEGIVGNLRRCLADDRPVRSLLNSAHHFVQQWRGSGAESMDSTAIVDGFAEWQAATDGPWAACINLMDTHFPYEPSPEHDRWGGETLRSLHAELERPPANEFVGGRPWWQLEAFEHLYDGTIREADAHVKHIVETLREADVHDETLVVLTSDHGEGFGEISHLTGRTRLVDHSWAIHEVLTHVPLVVKYPRQEEGTVVDEPASLVGFYDTVTASIEGSASRDSFVPDGPVVASTERLLIEDDGIFDGSAESAEDYYGPWRALYRADGGGVRKEAQRMDRSITVQIETAQTARVVGEGDRGAIDAAFEAFPDGDLTTGGRQEVDAEVEEKLTELGYLR